MATAPFKLTTTPFIQADNLRQRCHVCCNISPVSAYSFYPRSNIFIGWASGTWSRRSKGLETWDSSSSPTAGIEMAPFQVTARVIDVSEEAERGCNSCRLLKIGVGNLAGEMMSFDDENLEVDIIFCFGDAMRILIRRMSQDVEEDYDVFGNIMQQTAQSEEVLLSCEFYTLPGEQ